ncbi:DUF4340 domain-containing protein [Thiohalocapsa marina]|uniref:DUF4340 domain-containing protein n=1 Tax=Thiohalocapsa marina TaxID=424902 RepID=A0A5M8FEL8_9GAMM|nr:DUF4340 domain-containing protein [Thiohalocapsa marina]KAA6183328.1 DUF4340 domain-containing protein [Thiohalocapsa marina]
MSQAISDYPTTGSALRRASLRLDASWRQVLRAPLVLGLLVVLALQLVLALFLSRGASMAPAATDITLLSFEPEQIATIRIDAGEGDASVTLTRGEAGWVLPELGDFPASGTRIDQLLDSLAALRRPLPVATSAAARTRFRVADDDFERRLTLRGKDGDIRTLIVGDSPGFRRLFARLDGEDAIYDLRLALFDLSAEADDWVSRDQLRLDRERITRVAGPDWTLRRDEAGNWQLQDQVKPPAEAVVGDLLTTLSALSYRGVLGLEEQPAHGLETPLLTLDIELADGSGRRYRIGELEAGEDYALRVGTTGPVYRLAAFDLGGLLDLSLARLAEPAQDGEEKNLPPST